MAKINVAGEAVVITSELKLSDIKVVEKYRKKELTLMGGEDNKTPLFKVATYDGEGSLTAAGITFSKANSEGYATITIVEKNLVGDAESIAEQLADKYGAAIEYLDKLEEKLPEVIDEIEASKDAIKSKISVVC